MREKICARQKNVVLLRPENIQKDKKDMIITIARQCGCGAVNVGRLLSQHYGIPFYTRKNLMEMAAERGLSDRMADFFEERPVDSFLFSLSSYGEGPATAAQRPLQTLADMIGQENCIIIGRCGNYIFRRREDLVSVFLGGDIDSRLANIAEEEHLTPDDARDFLEHADECRAAYHKYYTGLTWGNATDYDLCLDTIRLGAERTAGMIQQYVEAVL